MSDKNKEIKSEIMEVLAEAVHQAYCKYYLKNKGEKYWTGGNYSLLNEATKQIDRETVQAVVDAMFSLGLLKEFTDE